MSGPAKLGPFHAKREELRAQSQILAELFSSNETNRQGLAREVNAAERAEFARARKSDADDIAELEAKGATATAHVRRLERHGHGTEAAIFKQANVIELRTEAERLADSEPPSAA